MSGRRCRVALAGLLLGPLVAGCGATELRPRDAGSDALEPVRRGLRDVRALAWDPLRAELVCAERGGDRLLRLPGVTGSVADVESPIEFRRDAQRPIGLAFDGQARLLVLEEASRSVVRYDRSGRRSVVCRGFDERRFAAPLALRVGPGDEVFVLDGGPRPALYRNGAERPGAGASPLTTRLPAQFDAPSQVALGGDPLQIVVVDGAESQWLRTARWAERGQLKSLRTVPVAFGGRPTALLGGDPAALLVAVEVPGGGSADATGELQARRLDGELLWRLPLPAPCTALSWGGAVREFVFVATRDAIFRLAMRRD